jgi:O-antigen ligase
VLAVGVAIALATVTAPYRGLLAAILAVMLTAVAILPFETLFLVLVFLAPLRAFAYVPVIGAELSATSLLLFGLAIGLVVRRLLGTRITLHRWEWFIISWGAWILFCWLWASPGKVGIAGVYHWSLFFGAVLLTVRYFDTGRSSEIAARRLLTTVLVLVSFWCVVGIGQVVIGRDRIMSFLNSPFAAILYLPSLLRYKVAAMDFNWLSGHDVRPFGPFINSIEFGVFTAAGLSVAVALAVSRSNLVPKWLAVFTGILALWANIAALKATGWLAALAALLAVFIALGGSVRRLAGFAVIVTSVISLAIAVFHVRLQERVANLALRERDPTAAIAAISRVAVWSHYFRVALEHPLTGSGPFTASTKGPVHWTVLGETGVTLANRMPTENSYLTLAVETGIPGLLLALGVIGSAAFVGLVLARRTPTDPIAQSAGAAAVGIVAMMVGYFSVDGLVQETNQLLLGLFVGIILVARRRSESVAGASE